MADYMDNLARDPERFSQPQDDNTGETTLHILSKEGKVEIIETLLNDERMEDHMVSEVLTNDLSYGTVHLWQYGLSSFQEGVQNKKYFCLRINMSKGNY